MSETDRELFKRAVGGVLPAPAYLVAWGAEVSVQSATGEVTVRLDDSNGRPAPGYSSVPCWFGIPGVFAQVPLGSRCKIAFDGAGNASPYIAAWDQKTSLTLLQIGKDDLLFSGVEIGGDSPSRKPVLLNEPLLSTLITLYTFIITLQERLDTNDSVTFGQLSNEDQATYTVLKTASTTLRTTLDTLMPQILLPNIAGGSVADKLRSA